jgi:hypothetical protein
MSYIVADSAEEARDLATADAERVHIVSLDSYCERQRIDRIDFLKIDTEGHDLEVLRGAEKWLSAGRIACIQCECSVNPDNTYHVAYQAIASLLEPHGFRLFAIYEQHRYWTRGDPNLERVDAVFISSATIERNRTAT